MVKKLLYGLDETKKKCYDSIMENNNELNQRIAKNLVTYRKAAGLTQAELAEKINYSDKSVSKWESGNGIPDVYTLLQLASLYGVRIGALVEEEDVKPQQRTTKGLHLLIALLSVGIVWLVAVLAFVVLKMFKLGGYAWLSFIYAIPASAIVLTVYACIWKRRLFNFMCVSTLIWSVLVTFFLTGRSLSMSFGWDYSGLWLVFLLGVPLQFLEVLWAFFRTLLRRQKKTTTRSADESEKK